MRWWMIYDEINLVSKMLANIKKTTAFRVTLASNKAAISLLVAHTGFEPVVSSLRGRCPRPLDECAVVR